MISLRSHVLLLSLVLLYPKIGAQEKTAALDAMVQDYVAEKQFIGSVLVAQNGAILLNKG